jgi:hypothetical protein
MLSPAAAPVTLPKKRFGGVGGWALTLATISDEISATTAANTTPFLRAFQLIMVQIPPLIPFPELSSLAEAPDFRSPAG